MHFSRRFLHLYVISIMLLALASIVLSAVYTKLDEKYVGLRTDIWTGFITSSQPRNDELTTGLSHGRVMNGNERDVTDALP